MRMRWISLFSLFSVALAGCGASQVKTTNAPSLPPSDSKEIEAISTPLFATPTEVDNLPKSTLLTAVPPQEDDMPKDPPLPIPRSPGPPALIEKAKADLAQRLSIPTTQIKVLKTKEASWPDASLGCPQPDMVYAQIPTPGYVVVLEYAGDEFEYHVGIHGNVLYCENPPPSVSGTPEEIDPFRSPNP